MELTGHGAAIWWPLIVNMDFGAPIGAVLPWPAFVENWRQYRVADPLASSPRAAEDAGDRECADLSVQSFDTADGEVFEWCSNEMSEVLVKLSTLVAQRRRALNVLLQGETGVGKEAMAKFIRHRFNSTAPYQAINCAAIPAELLESELFGVEGPWAFQGAKMRSGVIRAAHTGILLLDEIGDMPLHLQVKLLRFLEERRVRPVGADVEYSVDVVVVAATNRDLARDIADGRFREDLAQRLGAAIRIPPLRERLDDVRHFIDRQKKTWAPLAKVALNPDVRRLLINHQYAGNMRELAKTLEQALDSARAEAPVSYDPESDLLTIELRHLPIEFRSAWARQRIAGRRRLYVPSTNVVRFGQRREPSESEIRALGELSVGAIEGVRVITLAGTEDGSLASFTGIRRVKSFEFSEWTKADRLAFAEFVLRGGTVSPFDAPRLHASERYARLEHDGKEAVGDEKLWRSAEELEDCLVAAASELALDVLTENRAPHIDRMMLIKYLKPEQTLASIADSRKPKFHKDVVKAIDLLKDASRDAAVWSALDRIDNLEVAGKGRKVIALLENRQIKVTREVAFAAILFRFWNERQAVSGAKRIQEIAGAVFHCKKEDAREVERGLANKLNNDDFDTDESPPRSLTRACTDFAKRLADRTSPKPPSKDVPSPFQIDA